MQRNPISYSIWFKPEGKLYNDLKVIISYLSKRYTNIEFIPHVTLLSGFLGKPEDLIEKSKNLARRMSPFDLRLGNIAFLNEFFRFFFINVETDKDFINARKLAIKKFSYQDLGFLPHLSLAYGIYDESIIRKMKLFTFDKLGNSKGFYVDSIYLAHNNEVDMNWEIIEKFTLI